MVSPHNNKNEQLVKNKFHTCPSTRATYIHPPSDKPHAEQSRGNVQEDKAQRGLLLQIDDYAFGKKKWNCFSVAGCSKQHIVNISYYCV